MEEINQRAILLRDPRSSSALLFAFRLPACGRLALFSKTLVNVEVSGRIERMTHPLPVFEEWVACGPMFVESDDGFTLTDEALALLEPPEPSVLERVAAVRAELAGKPAVELKRVA